MKWWVFVQVPALFEAIASHSRRTYKRASKAYPTLAESFHNGLLLRIAIGAKCSQIIRLAFPNVVMNLFILLFFRFWSVLVIGFLSRAWRRYLGVKRFVQVDIWWKTTIERLIWQKYSEMVIVGWDFNWESTNLVLNWLGSWKKINFWFWYF